MTQDAQPHDLLWLTGSDALQGITSSWVSQQWSSAFPVVVRRDSHPAGLIPVGVRGTLRAQRAAGWVTPTDVIRSVKPEALANTATLIDSPFASMPGVLAARLLLQQQWPWRWGITGSTGFALATNSPVLHRDSDLDLVIRAPEPVTTAEFAGWQSALQSLPCRTDSQVETPNGAFSLSEWLREGRVLLKTHQGPRLVRDPWYREAS